jgi:hypothetical protein
MYDFRNRHRRNRAKESGIAMIIGTAVKGITATVKAETLTRITVKMSSVDPIFLALKHTAAEKDLASHRENYEGRNTQIRLVRCWTISFYEEEFWRAYCTYRSISRITNPHL